MGAFGGQWLWQGGWPVMAASETRDGQGAADNDKPFMWGRPRELLSIWQQAKLTVLRGFVMDARRGGERRNCANGDILAAEKKE